MVTVTLTHVLGKAQIIPSEARSLLRLESLCMPSGRISHVHLNFLSYSLQQLRPRPGCYCVKNCGLPQDDHARPTNSTFQLDYAYQVNKCAFDHPEYPPSFGYTLPSSDVIEPGHISRTCLPLYPQA